MINVDRDGLPSDDEIAIVLTRSDVRTRALLLIRSRHIARPSLEQRKVAVLLADQVGSALANPANPATP